MEERIFTYPVSPSPCKKISWKKNTAYYSTIFISQTNYVIWSRRYNL